MKSQGCHIMPALHLRWTFPFIPHPVRGAGRGGQKTRFCRYAINRISTIFVDGLSCSVVETFHETSLQTIPHIGIPHHSAATSFAAEPPSASPSSSKCISPSRPFSAIFHDNRAFQERNRPFRHFYEKRWNEAPPLSEIWRTFARCLTPII